MEECDYETVLAEMTAVAKDMKREDVLECFCEKALRAFISEQAESSSPKKMFAKLQASVDARAEIHELEKGMDKAHFVEIVTGGFFVVGGVDKATRLPINWWRIGLQWHNAWSYMHGSPLSKAFVRYAIMIFWHA